MEAAAWASIAGVPLAAGGIAATVLTSGSAQRERRQQFREWLQTFKAECDKARHAINGGQDIPVVAHPTEGDGLPQMPPVIAESLNELSKFVGEIRFVSDSDIKQLAGVVKNVAGAWDIVRGQIFHEGIQTRFHDGPSYMDLRRRIRVENVLLRSLDLCDKVVDRMQLRLQKLDRHNVVGAWRV